MMQPFLPAYGHTEGPLGFPMLDRQARQLDALLKVCPLRNPGGHSPPKSETISRRSAVRVS
jgi:hypothetical protein